MKSVLVTGARGFVGRNLCVSLSQRNDIEVMPYDLENSPDEFAAMVGKAHFIVHLAGVNRPKSAEEFDTGNRGFTKQLVDLLIATGSRGTVVLASSAQAALDNPYGASKKAAEDVIRAWSESTGGTAYIYRFPNLFGKWCRPNYNSVVATFCHNIATGVPIRVDGPEREITLAYIDDVVAELTRAIDGNPGMGDDGFAQVQRTYRITLGRLAETIQSFTDSRGNLVMPSLEDDLTRALYATYTSYLPEITYDLDMKRDARGWLAEFIKSRQFGQVFISRTKPGVTRGNHWHHTKVEKFLVIEGEALIRLRGVTSDEVKEIRVTSENLRVVDIPVGRTHSITNVGTSDLITLFWADEIFDPKKPDTYRLEV